MKSRFLSAFLVCGVLAGTVLSSARAADSDEAAQIQTLQSTSATLLEKRDACAVLKHIGTAHCIDALTPLLADKDLSLSARYVLESLPGKDAENALIAALPKTSGELQVGIIQSLGQRHDPAAISHFGNTLSSQDAQIAAASAQALAEIGGAKSAELLEHAVANSSGAVHESEVNGLLSCAEKFLEAGKHKEALKIFEQLYNTEKSDATRLAAFRGLILASGKQGVARMKEAILNGDAPSQGGALQAAALTHESTANKALVEILPQAGVPVQLAIIQCLAQHDDFSATPALVKQADNADVNVSIAAISALGSLGDASVVELLTGKAAEAGAKRTAARQALLVLNRGPVAKRMEELLKTAPTPVKLELARALSNRGDQSAVPALMDLAQSGNDEERSAAFQAIGQLADGKQISNLVKLVTNAKSDDARSGAADALSSVLQRIQSSGKPANVSAIASAIQSGDNNARLALIPVCSEVAQEPVRVALRSAEADKDARIREAAIHAVCDTKDVGLLPDLLKLASDTSLGDSRLLAVRGCVRLTTQEESVNLSNAQKLEALNAILATPLDTQGKQSVLSGLAAVPDPKALNAAVKLLDDSSVKAEAEDAVVRIATAIGHEHPAQARAALKKVVSESSDAGIKKSAQAALKKIK